MKQHRTVRLIIIGALILLTSGGVYFGLPSIRAVIKESRDKTAYTEAKTFLNDQRAAKAFEIIRMRDSSVPDRNSEWLHLEIEALSALGNIGRLSALYDRHPKAFMQHEKGSMIVARAMLATGDMKSYVTFRKAWESHEKQPELWFALDVDALILQQDTAGALKLLRSRSFEGQADAARLNRLALLTAGGNLQQAWQYLEQAYSVAPKNPDVRSFRAQILERMGKEKMARVEYVAAHLALPDNPLYRDQLAEFYRRRGQIGLAVQTWARDLNERSADFIRLKALFWSRVTTPASIGKTDPADIYGELAPLVIYLQELPEGQFWDDGLFEKEVAKGQMVLERRQEAYWLRILEALRNKEEEKCYDIILVHPFKRSSWNPDLEKALERVLAYRLEKPQPMDANAFGASGRNTEQRHQLFEQLERIAMREKPDPKLDRLLRSDEAFAAVFMAGGWMEAALQLRGKGAIPEGIPDWYIYGVTQSLRFNRDAKAALAFARSQRPTPEMTLLTGEILLANKERAASIEMLEPLTKSKSAIGYRAAWLQSLAYLDQKATDKARNALQRQPELFSSTAGKEILARIALAEGEPEKARAIYTSLADRSAEAKAYLAMLAYRQKDWNTCKILTMELIKEFPDRMELQANLAAINKAEKENRQ